MPVYYYKCDKCQLLHIRTKPIAERNDCPKCCEEVTHRIPVAPMFNCPKAAG